MSDIKAKMTFTEQGNEFDWEIWNGTPQPLKPVYDRFRRLGSAVQRVQLIGYEANESVSQAIAYFVSKEVARKQMDELAKNISSRFNLQFYNETFENCILLNAEFNLKHVHASNGREHELTAIITYMLDGEDE